MREIVVNGRFLSRRVTGVERYGREILSCMGDTFRLEKTRRNGLAGHVWEQFILPTTLKSESILWSPANTGPLIVSNQALTIHDLSPLEHPGWFKQGFAAWYRLFLPLLAKRARVIFTPSHYVKQKVVKRFNIANVVVTRNGVNPLFFRPGARQSVYELPEQFILFVGSLQPRKNLPTLLRVWDEIRGKYPGYCLVIAGDTGNIYSRVEHFARERVRFLGRVTEHALAGLYAQATLFVLPSLEEGFGLPALEAMACGTPVIVSDGGALPETVGTAGLIFPLANADSLAEAIQECLENRNLYSLLVANGLEHAAKFSWQTSAELIWKMLNDI